MKKLWLAAVFSDQGEALFGKIQSDEQIWELTCYVRSLGGPQQTISVLPTAEVRVPSWEK